MRSFRRAQIRLSSELRRGYLQYVIDPLLVRFNREIAARRDQIKQLLTEREKAGAAVSPDVFLAVSRSLVAAADARFEEVRKLESTFNGSSRQTCSSKRRCDAAGNNQGVSSNDEARFRMKASRDWQSNMSEARCSLSFSRTS